MERSSGHARLDNAALKAVRNWRWKPTLRDGIATKVRGNRRNPVHLRQRAEPACCCRSPSCSARTSYPDCAN